MLPLKKIVTPSISATYEHSHALFSHPLTVMVATTALVAFSTVTFELLLASYATYLLGSSLFRFAFVLSMTLSSIGIGIYLSPFVKKNPFYTLAFLEFGLTAITLLTLPILYYAFSAHLFPRGVLFLFIFAFGLCLGLGTTQFYQMNPTKKRVQILFSTASLGGFLGAMAFPLLLLPSFGFFQIASLLAVGHAIAGLGFVHHFHKELKKLFPLFLALAVFLLLTSLLSALFASPLRSWMEWRFFGIENFP